MENVTIVMIRDIGLELVRKLKKLKDQQMSTDKKKPAYGQWYIWGLAYNWAPNCPKRAEDITSQQSSVSTEKLQTESSVSTQNSSRPRRASEPDISDISPKRRRLHTRKMKSYLCEDRKETLLFHL